MSGKQQLHYVLLLFIIPFNIQYPKPGATKQLDTNKRNIIV